MRRAGYLLTACAAVIAGLAGCSGAHEVQTSPPRPYQPSEEVAPDSPRQARLRVFIQRGGTDLPEHIQQLTFRTAEIRLRATDGEWIRLPSDAGSVELERGRSTPARLVLDTRIPPASYDSMAVALSHVFVRFNENSGGPLTTAADVPQRLGLDLTATLDAASTIHLRLEPGPSLRRTQDCRWFFVPIYSLTTVSDAAVAP